MFAATTVLALTIGTAVAGQTWPTATHAAAAEPTTVTTDLPEGYDAAGSQAADTGQPVEVPEETTETTQVLAQPDGTFTLETYREPVRVQNEAGEWVGVDDTLEANADGTFSPRAASADVTFSGGGTGPLVTMATDEGQVSLTWPTALPQPVVVEDRVTYPEVMPGVDLTMIAASTGYKQVLTVKTRQAVDNAALAEIDMTAHADGLKLTTDSDGAFVVVDDAGASVLQGPRPYQWDSGAPAADDSATVSDTGAGRVHLADVESGTADGTTNPATTTVTLAPDMDALHDARTVYPVHIDPQMSSARTHYITVQSGGWDYYDDTTEPMRVGRCYTGTGECTQYNGVARSYFSVNVAALSNRPTTAQIRSAKVLAAVVSSASPSATPTELWRAGAFSASTNWGGPAQTLLETQSGSAGDTLAFSGSQVVSGFQAAANAETQNLSFGLVAGDETNQLQWKKFSINPKVVVNYDFPPSTPTSVDLAGNPVTCNGTNFTRDTTPTVKARATSNNPGVTDIGLGFEIYKAPVDGETKLRYTTSTVETGSTVLGTWATDTPGNTNSTSPIAQGRYAVRAMAYSRSELSPQTTSPWSSLTYFNVDSIPPSSPSIKSFDYRPNYWGAPTNRPGLFELASDSSTVGYTYAFDSSLPTITDDVCDYSQALTSKSGLIPASGGKAALTPAVNALAEGPHRLTVQAFDGAHNITSAIGFNFYVAPSVSVGTTRSYRPEATDPTQPSGQNQPFFDDGPSSAWSDTTQSRAIVANPTAGNAFKYAFTVPAAGYYALGASLTKGVDYGKVEFRLEDGPDTAGNTGTLLDPSPGDDDDSVFDAYAASTSVVYVPLGGVYLNAGTYRLRVTMTGTNPAATPRTYNGTYGGKQITNVTGYSIGMDYITLALLRTGTYSNLAAAFNNDGISAAGEAGNINLNTGNQSIAEEDLNAIGLREGATKTVDGVDFTRPASVGTRDNVIAARQQINVTSPEFAQAIHLLVASTCGATTEDPSRALVIAATDANGVTTNADLAISTVPDWLTAPVGTANVQLNRIKTGTAYTTTNKPTLYKLTASLATTNLKNKRVVSVTLPETGAAFTPGCYGPELHVFAITVN